ncbi:ParB/RepB/Spo0J family partition protein [Roseinatronobacter sp.]|uniref:ParB/RepB/Spo0J family partition protein n=1 Tax=Roseinatronobacter sp. TaxID=1945755 RepID=UPI0025FB9831|nr:ParB N-terminal domain-containing protein [Roseibaca sp.]
MAEKKSPRLMQIDRVPVADIEVSNRLRPVSEAGVESIMASIQETGVMKDAVHLRQKKGGKLVLIAGGHRLEAAKRLGWVEIEAKVWADVTDDWARLMEIDDNIAGAELSPLDTALFLAARKRIYEKLHPEATRGGDRRSPNFTDQTEPNSVCFVKATSEKFGLTERQIYKIVAAGGRLGPRDISLLRQAPKPVTLKDLTEISKISETVERYDVVAALSEGRAKSVADARRQRAADACDAPVEDPIEAAFKALDKAWARAPMAAKKRFLFERASEVWEAQNKGAALHKHADADRDAPAPESAAPAFASRRGAA